MQAIRSIGAVLLCLVSSAVADDRLSSLTKAVTAFKLQNGAQFFVVERPYSPFVNFHLRARAGAADEPSGRGGLAALALVNFLEGSETYGTRNQAAEKAALAEAEKLLEAARMEQAKGELADEVKKGRTEFHAKTAFDEATGFGQRPRYFEGILVDNGATGFEFRPTADFSDLAMSLSSEKAELWFRMVGSWLQAPSSRFFAQSRDTVVEQREKAGKTGAVQRERAFGAAFSLHPYQTTASGDGELNWAGPDEVKAFLKTHYAPANLTIAIVGDITGQEARRLAELYFGKLPAVELPAPRGAQPLKPENAQPVRLALPEAPIFAAAWPRPSGSDHDDVVFEMLQALLAGGPGSRMHNELTVEAKFVNRLAIRSRYPGGRYPCLFLIETEPLPTRSLEEVEAAIFKVIEAVGQNGVTAEELERARQWWRRRLLADSRLAAGRASQLVRWHTEYGTYKVDEWLAKLDAVTAADCKRVLSEYLAGKPYFSVTQLTAVSGAGQ